MQQFKYLSFALHKIMSNDKRDDLDEVVTTALNTQATDNFDIHSIFFEENYLYIIMCKELPEPKKPKKKSK